MNITQKKLKIIDRWYLFCMACIAPLIIYFNWYATGMAGLLSGYAHFKDIILQSFIHDHLITFPMWGYGWLMLITENKLGLLLIQVGLALVSLFYFVRFLEQEKIFPIQAVRLFKMGMIVSLPWYAFHALRWPYSISASLFLCSFVLLYKAITHTEYVWRHLIGSALCFGLLLNFRSDYWLMPIGFVFLIIVFQRNKKAFLFMGVWLISIYTCLIPWALYTKKACGHYSLTSTNSGHVMFIGLGNDPQNRWKIESHDGDPLMHTIVDEHFKKWKHSTLDYEADQFLKNTFFSYISSHPWDYLKKCWYALKMSVVGGFYPGEFFMTSEKIPEVRGSYVRSLLLSALISPSFFMQHFYEIIRFIFYSVSWLMGKYLLILSYCLLPITLWSALFFACRAVSLFMLLLIAALAYQTMLNVFCYHMASYTSNMYVFFLLNAIYGVLLVYGFASDWFRFKFRRSRFVLGSRG